MTRLTTITLAAALLGAASPAASQSAASAAQPAAAGPQAIALPTASVAAVYSQFNVQPMWFKGGAPTAAAPLLVNILKRSVVEGFAAGPLAAAQVEAAMAQARSGDPAMVAAAERTLSAAWVAYVQAIKRPTPGMIYAYPVLEPQGSRPDQILLTAAAAPALDQHLLSVASVNPLYAQIRDAEWARMQSAGSPTPDHRAVANLERLRSIPAKGRFILVDSGSQRMSLYENGVPVDSMKVIVGTDELATPLIASVMHYVIYNPYWNAPEHLVRKAIAPKTIAGGMKYFNSMGYEVMSDWSAGAATIPAESIDWKAVAAGKLTPRIRQKPGEKNFMGVLKFPFPNSQDIYLHDTPAKELFSKASRDLSNGCVRVEDAKRFGRWLLGRDPVPPGNEPETAVQLPRGVPIYLTYVTARVDGGQLTYLRDIYGWDKPGAQVASSYVSPVSRQAR